MVDPYIEEHKKILVSKFPEKSEAWITREHMNTFCSWLRKHLMHNMDTKEAPIKPWDMSLEECDRITQERVKEHFKPKPEKVINPIDLKFFKGMCEANKRKFIPRDPPPSDYECTIIKTTEKKKR